MQWPRSFIYVSLIHVVALGCMLFASTTPPKPPRSKLKVRTLTSSSSTLAVKQQLSSFSTPTAEPLIATLPPAGLPPPHGTSTPSEPSPPPPPPAPPPKPKEKVAEKKSPEKKPVVEAKTTPPPPPAPKKAAETKTTPPPKKVATVEKKQEVAPPTQKTSPPPPKSTETKKTTAPTSTATKSAPSAQQQKALSLLKQSLASLDQPSTPSGTKKSSGSKPSNSLTPLASENLSFAPGDLGARYEDELATYLKHFLELPEKGDVKIRLTLNKQGQFISLSITSSSSDKNKNYVERTLPQLNFPPFSESLKAVAQRSFSLTLTSRD